MFDPIKGSNNPDPDTCKDPNPLLDAYPDLLKISCRTLE